MSCNYFINSAKKTLSLLLVPPKAGNSEELVPAIEFFDQLEIYPVDDLHVVIEGKVIRGMKIDSVHALKSLSVMKGPSAYSSKSCTRKREYLIHKWYAYRPTFLNILQTIS